MAKEPLYPHVSSGMGMTNEELQRIRQYAAKIIAADGSLMALTDDESRDLETLIEKRLRLAWRR